MRGDLSCGCTSATRETKIFAAAQGCCSFFALPRQSSSIISSTSTGQQLRSRVGAPVGKCCRLGESPALRGACKAGRGRYKCAGGVQQLVVAQRRAAVAALAAGGSPLVPHLAYAAEAPVAMTGCLDDVLALIHCPPDPVANAKAAIAARIEKHGGRVAARLGKDVSHIIWERRHSRRPSEKAADEADLLELFRKLEKVLVGVSWVTVGVCSGQAMHGQAMPAGRQMSRCLALDLTARSSSPSAAAMQSDYPPVVVSPLWVEESIKAGRRLVERKYLVGGWLGCVVVAGAAKCSAPACAGSQGSKRSLGPALCF